MNNTEDHTEETHEGPIHEGPIKTPKQLIVTVVLAFIVPVLIIFLLIRLVVSSDIIGAGSDAQTPEAIAMRIQPVAGFELVDANAPKVFKTGQQVYESTCASCHGAGIAGAPKFGDKDAWAPFIAQGYEQMLKIALEGKGAMPPKGGNPNLDDFEVARAVVYMANESGASFDEPQEPAAEGEAGEQAKDSNENNQEATTAAQAPTESSDAPAAAQEEQQAAESDQGDSNSNAAAEADTETQQQAATAPAEIDPAGEKLYNTVCLACHAAGVAGAPKLGDKAAWEPLAAQGIDTLVSVVMSGKGAMPPKGGAVQASEADIRAAVQFMVSKAQ
ncbi:MAG TPA: cytochrome c5 family protein [Pusillimonas sp.]|jgi:cytochrome c5|nr:cytochrome c5 family protein [Pusillimonas sp.]MBC41435.1 cytochrome c5 family protein [Pusillimonas sp.]HBT33852.1 cytochrome c5 family protein [Pusillimonas sp.]HCN71568.1 cytochrome c5 family protein [Pusillimonas sp.]HCP79123.1 cytochrome c5 family protein [Pusillimonas sp.]|tara:strand:- start:26481 stop:27473 length:993 start_codon:yes stop_codon:yes gene_type:complete